MVRAAGGRKHHGGAHSEDVSYLCAGGKRGSDGLWTGADVVTSAGELYRTMFPSM